MIIAITAPAWPGIINKEDKTMANITSNNEDLLNKVKLIQPGVPIQFPTVKPGDLITAELINAIMRVVESLDKRVTTLEGASANSWAPVITGLSPSMKRIQNLLYVNGRNFSIDCVVHLSGYDYVIDQFNGSSTDKQLIFVIPLIQGVTDQGKEINLTVTNQYGSDSMIFVLYPALPTIPTGKLNVFVSKSPDVPVLEEDNEYVFVFTVNAITTLDDNYVLEPRAFVESTGVEWPAIIVDDSGTQISPPRLFINKSVPPGGTNSNVNVKVSIPSGASDTPAANLTLKVSSVLNPTGLNKKSGNYMLTVGSEPAPGQDKVIVSFASPGINASVSGDDIVITPNTKDYATLNFKAYIKDIGIYNLEARVENDPGKHWEVQSYPSIDVQIANSDVSITLYIKADSKAVATNIILKVVSNTDVSCFGETSEPIRI